MATKTKRLWTPDDPWTPVTVDAGQHAVEFIERRLVHTKGRWRGQPFYLLPWQEHKVIRPLFGTLRKDGRRQFREAWIEVAKKNGKSELGAAIALKALLADGEPSAEVYSVANDRKQAGIVFNVAADMVELNPVLAMRCKVYRSRIAHHGTIYVPKTGSVYRVLSADAATNDGINASCVVVDEPHRAPNRAMIDLMAESGLARDQFLLVFLTTAGEDDPDHVAKEKHDYAVAVRDGAIKDPTFLPVLFFNDRLPNGEWPDWKSKKTFLAANPSAGTRADIEAGNAIIDIDEAFTDMIGQVDTSPAKRRTFQRLRLNFWLPPSASNPDKFIDLHAWDRSAGLAINIPKRATVYEGLDLASSEDVTALAVIHPDDDCRQASCRKRPEGELCYQAELSLWIPGDRLKPDDTRWSKELKERMRAWADEGWITVTDGAVKDDDVIFTRIAETAKNYDVAAIAYDYWQALSLAQRLEDEGFNAYAHDQRMPKIGPPTKYLTELAAAQRFHHGGHPVLRWMVDNAVVRRGDSGDMKLDRKRSAAKIDGLVAVVMGLSAAFDSVETEGETFAFSVTR